MKSKILGMMLISLFSIIATAQNGTKNNPVGTWKFAAPYAPEGYNSGTIVVGIAEQKHTTLMSFAGSEYKFPGENVKSLNDSVLFSIFLEGEDIKVMLKVESDTTMSGKAVYSGGEVPLSLTKILALEDDVK